MERSDDDESKTVDGTLAIDPQALQLYKDYCKAESDEAYKGIVRNEEEYDKQLLTLSTGTFAVLVAFLKDIVRLDQAIKFPLLYLGLGSLVLTICLVLISFQVSIEALEQVRIYYSKQFEGESDSPFPERWGNRVKYVNRAAGVCFLSGISFTTLFIIINLHHQIRH